jgi:hypothetical protein
MAISAEKRPRGRPPGSAEITYLREEIRALRQHSGRQAEQVAYLAGRCVDFQDAARTLMTEALMFIAYYAQTDLKREWLKRWPWLSEEASGGTERQDERAGGGEDGSPETEGGDVP